MVQKLRHLWGRVEVRVLVLLVFGFLLAGLALAVAQLAKASFDDAPNLVSSWEDLVKRYLGFREDSYALVVPAWCMSYGQTETILNEYGFEELQKEPDWYWTFEGGMYVFEGDSELAKLVKDGTQIVIYEDMAKEELVVLSAPEKEGGEWREEIVYTAPIWPEPRKGEDYERYLIRELSQRRIVWQVTLKSRSVAEKEAAEAEAAQAEAQEEDGGGGMMLLGMEEYSNHLWVSIRGPAAAGLTNLEIAAHIPSGFTNAIEIFTCTNLVDFWWTLAETNVLTEGTDTVYWTYQTTDAETGPVFVAIGNAAIDSDGDGIVDAREKFLSHTDPELSDTDGDGLPDGWEIGNGLNPLSAQGNDGADGDVDGDGLSNMEEYGVGASPWQYDTVIVLGPDDLYEGGGMMLLFGPGRGIQYRSLSALRSKCGFAEFTDALHPPSTPPKYYLAMVQQFDALSTVDDGVQEGSETASKTVNYAVDPTNCSGTTICSGSASFDRSCPTCWPPDYWAIASGSWDSDCVWTGSMEDSTGYSGPYYDPLDHLFLIMSCIDPPPACVYSYTNTLSHTQMVSEESKSLGGGQYVQHAVAADSLQDEYTTSMLLAIAADDLDRCGTLEALNWGEGRTWDGTCETGSAVTAASRDLSADEAQIALTKLGYRFRVANLQTGQIYRLNWAECFTPEGSSEAVVLQARTLVFRGTGGLQNLESADYTIDPPETDGVIEPVVLQVEVVGPDKTTTWPCECVQSKVIIGAKIVPAIPNQTIEWSFVGQSFGATLAEGYPIGGNYPPPPPGAACYATVTPGTHITGSITVRAKIAGLDCYADTDILVHAVPTEIQQTMQSIQPPAHVPYVAYYKHRFESSGGDLNNVQIWERVELVQDPFEASGFPIAYGDTPPWILDSSGLMDEWDEIYDPWNSYLRDLNRWLPAPCHGGLPVVMSTPQSFAWKCPLCAEYNEFETHDILTGFNEDYSLDVCGSMDNPEYVIVDNGSDHYDEYQSTPVPVLDSITVMPASIAANGTNTALVAADCCWIDSPQSIPPPQQWSWAAGQNAPGCSYNVLNSCAARITAGTNAGQVVIGLYADWQCNYETATLTLTQP